VRDVALVPQRDVLEAGQGRPSHDARETADPLGDDGVPLVRHRRRPLLPRAERLGDLGDLRPREVPDLERELVERAREHGQRREQLRVAVALEDLGRRRRRLQPEPLAGDSLDLRVGRGVRPHRAGELSDPHPGERALQPLAAPGKLEGPHRKFQAERRRLGMHPVRPADHQRGAVLVRTRHDRLQRTVDAGQNQPAGVLDLQRERRVDDVRGRQPVVEPPPERAELLADRVHEGRHVVLRPRLDLGHARRRRNLRPLADRACVVRRYRAELGPRIQGGELDLEPARELVLLRPHRGHGGSGVPGDHLVDRSVGRGRQRF
jgi:hypothetical protein